MIWILAALLLPLHFTAPADTLGADGAGRARVSRDPVRSYVFLRLEDRGVLVAIAGYADSGGTSLLQPHRPGTRETVWLAPGEGGRRGTIYVLSIDRSGNLSAPSNACALEPAPPARWAAFPLAGGTAPDAPIVMGTRGRFGHSALEAAR